MRSLFVDTAGFMAMADAADPAHEGTCAARDAHLRSGGALVSTDYVLDETLTLVRMRLSLDAAEALWTTLERSSRLRWEWIDPVRGAKARSWFFRYRDKRFSFTDCTSFVVMRELRMKTALTSDDHFVQAGFTRLP